MKKYIKPIIEINLIESSSNIATTLTGSTNFEKAYTNEVTKSWDELF